MVKIKCMLVECNHFNLLTQECSAEEVELDSEGVCLNAEVINNCCHIIGTVEAYHRPYDESSEHLVFASNIAGSDPERCFDDIDKFNFCPNCGKKLFN